MSLFKRIHKIKYTTDKIHQKINISKKNQKSNIWTIFVQRINTTHTIRKFKKIYFLGKWNDAIFLEKYHPKINNNIWLTSVTYAAHIKLYFGIKIIFQMILKRVIKILIFKRIDSFLEAIKI